MTIPSSKYTNKYVPLESFSKHIPLLTLLLNKAENLGVSVEFSKPIPLCLFDKNMAKKLMIRGCGMTLCGIHESRSMRNISLSPSLKLTPCLGLTGPQISFPTAMSWNDISKVYKKHITSLLEKPSYERCKTCYLWERYLCQGVCLAYKEQ